MAWATDESRLDIFRKEMVTRPTPQEYYEKFEEALVLGYIAGDVKFTKQGECEFTIKVPHKYAEHCHALRHAIGVPCEIFIKKWDGT